MDGVSERPIGASRVELPVPGDYHRSAEVMPEADKSDFLKDQSNRFISKVRERMTPQEIQLSQQEKQQVESVIQNDPYVKNKIVSKWSVKEFEGTTVETRRKFDRIAGDFTFRS
jgi:hypothetical protein